MHDRRNRCDALPASARIGAIDAEPLPAHRRLGAGSRRIGRDEGCVRQPLPPRMADVDQIVAVGAIAMQQHDELSGGAGERRNAQPVSKKV